MKIEIIIIIITRSRPINTSYRFYVLPTLYNFKNSFAGTLCGIFFAYVFILIIVIFENLYFTR